MNRSKSETVLVVCEEEERARDILEKLFMRGIDVIGPASTARLALALAAQSAPTVALVAQSPTGRRKAEELAHELFTTWGVQSLVLADAAGPDGGLAMGAPWAPAPEIAEHLLSVLEDVSTQRLAS